MQFRDQVDVLNAADLPVDGHNNPVPDWDQVVGVREPAIVQPVSSTENITAEQVVISRWRAFLLPLTTATATSRLRWRGDVYEVDGDVQLFPDLRGRPHHREAFLRRVQG